jgi:DNA primase large subunit
MRVSLETKDFAKYPFLKESQQFMLQNAESVDQFIHSGPGRIALKYAVERVQHAIPGEGRSAAVSSSSLPSENFEVRLEVSAYALARVLVSCTRDRALVDRLTRFEAQRAAAFLQEEEEEKRVSIAERIGFPIRDALLPVTRYVEVTAGMREERWRLVNREVWGGLVDVTPLEAEELLREQIRVALLSQLPLDVPDSLCRELSPYTSHIQEIFQQRMLEDFGEVNEDCFPPCMHAILSALSSGTNITHPGRFALTAFLHNIGMDSTRIIEFYTRAPDFDISKTQYQVEHISGRGGAGTEYTAPSCAAMRTFGICVKSDPLCEKVNHPLSYYKLRKKGKTPVM